MGVGLTAAHYKFHGRQLYLYRLPGSWNSRKRCAAAIPAVDAAVVLRADERKLHATSDYPGATRKDLGIPRFCCFSTRLNGANKRIRETWSTLQPARRGFRWCLASDSRSGTGDESLVRGIWRLERAFVYREQQGLPKSCALEGGNLAARGSPVSRCWKKLADHDDALMEQLLEDISAPDRNAVFDDLRPRIGRDGE